MEYSCISPAKRLDKCRCPHPNVSPKPKFDHLHNSKFSGLGLGGLCCPVVPRSESLSALHPSQHGSHPETGWSGAKAAGAGVAGGLPCGHPRHRASVSLKIASFPHWREDRPGFAGQVEMLLGQLYLLGMLVVACCVCSTLPFCLLTALAWPCQVWDGDQQRSGLEVVPGCHGAHARDSGDLQLWPWLCTNSTTPLPLHQSCVGLFAMSQGRGNAWRRGSRAELRIELCNLLCNSGGRQECSLGGGSISDMLLHLGFSFRHTPASVCWRALTHPLKTSSPPTWCVRNPSHARFWILFYHRTPQFVPLQYQNWGVSNHCVSLLRSQSLN